MISIPPLIVDIWDSPHTQPPPLPITKTLSPRSRPLAGSTTPSSQSISKKMVFPSLSSVLTMQLLSSTPPHWMSSEPKTWSPGPSLANKQKFRIPTWILVISIFLWIHIFHSSTLHQPPIPLSKLRPNKSLVPISPATQQTNHATSTLNVMPSQAPTSTSRSP